MLLVTLASVLVRAGVLGYTVEQRKTGTRLTSVSVAGASETRIYAASEALHPIHHGLRRPYPE